MNPSRDAEGAGLKAFLDLSDFKLFFMKHCRNPYRPIILNGTATPKFTATRVNSITGRKYGTDREIGLVFFSSPGEPREAGYLSDGTWHDGKYYTYTGAGNRDR